MYEVGVTTSRLMVEEVVETALAAWSVAVPVVCAVLVSWLTVHVVVTLTGPVCGRPAGAVPPVPNVPVAVQPLAAIPESRSPHVNVTTTSLRYQPLLPGVPLVMAHVMVGGVLSTRTGP